MKLVFGILALLACTAHAQAPPGRSADVRAFGAKCDGKADDTVALQKAFDWGATVRGTLRVPAGRQCNFIKPLNLTSARLVGYGHTSVLYAVNWNNSAIMVRGTRPEVRSLRLTVAPPPSRQSGTWFNRITVRDGARDFLIENVLIEGGAAGGIMVTYESGPGRIMRNIVKDTLADAIHMTGASHGLHVEGNLVENAGDDGIAVVSYKDQGARTRDVVGRHNIIRNLQGGRNLSSVGGENVLYEFNTLDGNAGGGACVIIAQEDSYNTFSARNIVIRNNTMRNCPINSEKGHAAITATANPNQPNENLLISRNLIVIDGPTQGGVFGIRIDGGGENVNAQVIGNLIVGPNQYKPSDLVRTPYLTQLPVGDPGR